MQELQKVVEAGGDATVFFLIQRPDVELMRPAWEIDPGYSEALANAQRAGVDILAYCCQTSREGIALSREIPMELSK